jgi:anti-sigma B factor antagonist
MKLRESRHDNVDVFHLAGEIDLHYAPALRGLLHAKATQHCPALVVDLSEVPFIDSTGISVLIEYLRDASDFGGQFCLAAPTTHVRDVFEIVQLRKALTIFESVDEALAAFANGVVPTPAVSLFTSDSAREARAGTPAAQLA